MSSSIVSEEGVLVKEYAGFGSFLLNSGWL